MGQYRFNSETARAAGKKSSKKGKKHMSTIMKEKVKDLAELEEDVILVYIDLLKSRVKEDRKFAASQISKYIFATKKESTIDLDAKQHIHIYTVKPDELDKSE